MTRRAASRGILATLKRLDATLFENLVYDLLILTGFSNLTWRTPGADGGRDIQGEVLETDKSGTVSLQKWYVECKRYELSLDWPLIAQKIAYAENHQADYLLVCTTAFLSPRCKDELAARELRHQRPFVRYWDGPDLENRVGREPLLHLKYALDRSQSQPSRSIAPLVVAASKVVQAAYGESVAGKRPATTLELAAALVDLITKRLDDAESGTFRPSATKQDVDLYEWCEVLERPPLKNFDRYGMRALLCALKHFEKATAVSLKRVTETPPVVEARPLARCSPTMLSVLTLVALWSNLDVAVGTDRLIVSARVTS